MHRELKIGLDRKQKLYKKIPTIMIDNIILTENGLLNLRLGMASAIIKEIALLIQG